MGRQVGSQCGLGVWALAQKYFDGSVTNTPVNLAIRTVDGSGCELYFNSIRAFYYKLQSTTDLSQPFVDEPGGYIEAFDLSMVLPDTLVNPRKYYRVVRASSGP